MHYLVIAHLFLIMSCSVVDSAIQMVIKFLQQVGCTFMVSLAAKVLVEYVLLPHYVLVMEAADCAHWIRKVVLEQERWTEANTPQNSVSSSSSAPLIIQYTA